MDNSQEPPTVLSFCSGYGGLELGLERVFGEISILAHVEIEDYAITNLVKEMEQGKLAPSLIWSDVKTFPSELFSEKIDIFTGGYPCQPFSSVGKRLGDKDPRHLWPYFRRTIDVIRPRICFFENVEGHITEGLYDVLDDLGGLGYKSTWGMFTAAEVGAAHYRPRVFIMAHAIGVSLQILLPLTNEKRIAEFDSSSGSWTAKQGQCPFKWEKQRTIESRVDGTVHGNPNWKDQLKLLGNGVVPMTAALAFKTLWRELKED